MENIEKDGTAVRAGRIVSVGVAAGMLGVSCDTVKEMVRHGRLPVEREDPSPSQPQGRLWFQVEDVEKLKANRARIKQARRILRRLDVGEIVLEDDDLLTTGDAGLLLGCTAVTFANRIRAGEFEHIRTPGGQRRVRYEVVRKILEAREGR